MPLRDSVCRRAARCSRTRRSLIAEAPYESTMGLVQKIFYFHVPSWIAMFTSAFVCGIASAIYPVSGRQAADAWRSPPPSSPWSSA